MADVKVQSEKEVIVWIHSKMYPLGQGNRQFQPLIQKRKRQLLRPPLGQHLSPPNSLTLAPNHSVHQLRRRKSLLLGAPALQKPCPQRNDRGAPAQYPNVKGHSMSICGTIFSRLIRVKENIQVSSLLLHCYLKVQWARQDPRDRKRRVLLQVMKYLLITFVICHAIFPFSAHFGGSVIS